MSEFSDSFHIRTDDPAECLQRLRRARLAGITFGPSNGWLTFIPYEELKAFRDAQGEGVFARQLSQILSAAVLHYSYGEDHGWSFTWVRPGEAPSGFACWWNPEPTVERARLDLEALRPIADVDALAPLFEGADAARAFEWRPAYAFAEILRLPAYKWLSPQLAQRHTGDLIEQGGRKLGTRPPTAAERLKLPPRRTIAVPRPDLSAREALQLLTPFMRGLGPAWTLASLFGGGNLTSGGRLAPGVGLWQFSYVDTRRPLADSLSAWLYFNGSLSFHAQGPGPSTPENLRLLEADWLDSADVAERLRAEPSPEGFGAESGLTMMLQPVEGSRLYWQATRTSIARDEQFLISRHVLIADAMNAEVLFETFEQTRQGRTILARQRRRWEGGDWENIAIDAEPDPEGLPLD